jgi:hypothetical protein
MEKDGRITHEVGVTAVAGAGQEPYSTWVFGPSSPSGRVQRAGSVERRRQPGRSRPVGRSRGAARRGARGGVPGLPGAPSPV